MKVYIVTAGEYSDYHIEAAFTDYVTAATFCAVENEKVMNERAKGHCCFGEECRIEEVNTLDDKLMANPDNHYGYIFEEDWVRRCIRKGWSPLEEGTLCIRPESDYLKKGFIFVEGLDKHKATEKVLKIVADRMAEEKAIEEGIV